jgi:hypothetical protein
MLIQCAYGSTSFTSIMTPAEDKPADISRPRPRSSWRCYLEHRADDLLAADLAVRGGVSAEQQPAVALEVVHAALLPRRPAPMRRLAAQPPEGGYPDNGHDHQRRHDRHRGAESQHQVVSHRRQPERQEPYAHRDGWPCIGYNPHDADGADCQQQQDGQTRRQCGQKWRDGEEADKDEPAAARPRAPACQRNQGR